MKILCVIDMQKDFVDGALGTPEAQGITENVAEKIRCCREKGYKIIFTRDTHPENYMDTLEGKNLPVPHCIKDSDGWQLHGSVPTEKEDIIIDKPTFGSTELCKALAGEKAEEIEVIGLCTDICVISNALMLKAHFPETPIIVDSSCCAGVTPESHGNALEAMKMCQISII